MAVPSLAEYSVAANDDMRFGEGTEVYGHLHANGGIRFDGLAHNIVSSSLESYSDPDHSGGDEFGVHTHVFPTDPLPPAEVPDREDVFEAGREFPLPTIDFVGLTTDLASIKSEAQASGEYYPASGYYGYHITLKTDDTYDLYVVTRLQSPPRSYCYNNQNQDGWGTWSVGQESFIGNEEIPENGLLFFEDHVWVDGQIDGARLTIAAGRFPDSPSTRRSITVNNDLLYTNYDGDDVIALIAQDDINVGLYSEDDLQIDAALVAQNGRVGRYFYPTQTVYWIFYVNACTPYDVRSELTLNGTIITNERYGFAYDGGNGYQIRNLNYDANLLYSPPPSFPLTSDQYEILKWREVE